MFCFVEDTKIISGIVKEIQLWNRTDKTQIFNPFPVVRVRFVHRVVSLVNKLSVKHPNSLVAFTYENKYK